MRCFLRFEVRQLELETEKTASLDAQRRALKAKERDPNLLALLAECRMYARRALEQSEDAKSGRT